MKNIKSYLMLWSTQSLSSIGSAMTSYALVLWLYTNSQSALKTAYLSVCSYAPYVLMSIFAGALSDRWNKKRTMLVCDALAAVNTLVVFLLIKTNSLCVWHLYVINAIGGLMNTAQQPAGEVVATLLVPKEYYQKTSGLRSFSQSLNSILTPVLATMVFTLAGIEGVIAVDIFTFLAAFITLGLFIKIPEHTENRKEPLMMSVKSGLSWLKNNPLILKLILFLACINFVASAYDAALPAMVLSKSDKTILGIVNMFIGIATVSGSLLVTVLPVPKNRVRTICAALTVSMSTENFLLAFGTSPATWCIGAFLGWIVIPFMNANMDVIFRNEIPPDMQGRVYSCRNTFQFFTIPLGLIAGGALVDKIFEPFMSKSGGYFAPMFGTGKGSGAAMLFFILGIAGVVVCIVFGALLRKYKWNKA